MTGLNCDVAARLTGQLRPGCQSGGAAEDGGWSDGVGAELVADAVHGLLGPESVVAGVVEADLLGDPVGVDEVFAAQGDAGEAAALQAGGVHQLVGELT